MSYKYDLFIIHASEDKDFVRPLAEALRAQRLAVWFDEFELKPGMGLRKSIDQGLLSSRFGLVVLSPAFFAKSWPRWELDGLVQLAHSRPEPTILPIWHKVAHSDVAAFSPSLANIVAIPSFEDPDRTTAEVFRVLRPRPTAVEVAREVLVEFEFPAPVLSDDWWLDAAVWSAPAFGEGTFQEASSWGWWGFALPPEGNSPEAKGQRIAWAAMQHSWQEAAAKQRITPCTHPSRVLEFIQSQPGLEATAESELDYLLSYVPQLGIPGCAGFLEPLIDSVFLKASSSIKARPTHGAPGWVFRDPDLCGLTPDDIVERYFWPTDPTGTSPDANVLAWVDAAAWIASSASDWLPSAIKAYLTEGLASFLLHGRMRNGNAATWEIRESERWKEVMYGGLNAMTQPDFVREARKVFEERAAVSCELLDLPESPPELVEQIVSWGVLGSCWTHNASRQF
jgi:hypothetical protein